MTGHNQSLEVRITGLHRLSRRLRPKVQHAVTEGRLYASLATMLNLASREDQSR